MATAASKAQKERLAQGGGKKSVAIPKSGLVGSLEQVQLLTWRDFTKSMDMGATVLSAQNPMASELLMVPVVNDGVMIVENQDCTLANKNSVPPEVMIHDGKLLDFRHRGIAHFGELVLAPLAHQGPGYKSIDSPTKNNCCTLCP